MKSLVPYLVCFVLLVLAAWYLGKMDPITGAVAEAHASEATGSLRLDILNEAFALLFHLTTGGIIVTAVMWLIVEGGKVYRRYWLEKNTRRWDPGRRAYSQPRPATPKLTREDIMLMMLGQQRDGRLGRVRPSRPRREEDGDELDIDF